MDEPTTFIQKFLSLISNADSLTVIALAVVSLFSATVSLRYLQGRSGFNWTNEKEIRLLREETNRIASALRRQSQASNAPKIPEDEWEKIKSEAVKQSISILANETQEQMKILFRQRSTHGLRKQLFDRLNNQLSALERRANFSLVLGMIFSIAGLIVLYLSFFESSSPISYQELLPSIIAYAPRLSLVLIIEAVAFFFLRLYSKAIDEIRYTQNEITNVEMKILSLDESLIYNASDSVAHALKGMSETERNFVLKNGETTANIEQAKIIGATISSGKDGILKRIFPQSE